MIVKAVTFFLIGMGVLAMFGKLRLPGLKRPPKIGKAQVCKACGVPLPRGATCPCKKG